MFKLVLTRAEVLALDEYFTYRAGYIGHDGEADETAHALANIISEKAEEIRVENYRD